MVTLRAPDGASDALRHAVELVNRDLDRLLEKLDTRQQHQVWSNLHQYALGRSKGREGRSHLIASAERVDAAAREALELSDEKITEQMEALSWADRRTFWELLHEFAEQQAETTGHSKIRYGGGGQ